MRLSHFFRKSSESLYVLPPPSRQQSSSRKLTFGPRRPISLVSLLFPSFPVNFDTTNNTFRGYRWPWSRYYVVCRLTCLIAIDDHTHSKHVVEGLIEASATYYNDSAGLIVVVWAIQLPKLRIEQSARTHGHSMDTYVCGPLLFLYKAQRFKFASSFTDLTTFTGLLIAFALFA